MGYFNKFFGIYGDNKENFIYFLGKKFNFKKKTQITIEDLRKELINIKNETLKGVQRSITTAFLHQKTFAEFKNKHFEQNIALIGAGPTLNDFNPLENVIYLGLNRAFLKKEINFDYLFTIDKIGLMSKEFNYFDDFINYRQDNCIKFIGDQNLGVHFQIPEGKIIKTNSRRYKTTAKLMPSKFTLDIDSEPLGNFATVSLQAIQFILFTNPKKIYLVGIDCTCAQQGHFTGANIDLNYRNENALNNDKNSIENWNNLKFFKDMYYPDTEIISINPVGLKGIFKDVYTRSFVEKHPELQNENIEIID